MSFDPQLFLDALLSEAFLRGAALTVALALCSQLAAVILGFGLALCRVSHRRAVRGAAEE